MVYVKNWNHCYACSMYAVVHEHTFIFSLVYGLLVGALIIFLLGKLPKKS
ncbi:hypothetical protein [Staphylococcus muscae]|uniref:Uncharacterized protein n=1 Tax=Staphylococcus muscae TaxID=1294 RepID=A0A240BTR1_9STAP|nr:hypothetical protein [Staphylococcus muscae]GGA82298.1 hypothetical protein GCM10007183_03110 [Staphylococcus muscae]SNV98453.1 Uncharacterised protein [Staphylococcus muscae]